MSFDDWYANFNLKTLKWMLNDLKTHFEEVIFKYDICIIILQALELWGKFLSCSLYNEMNNKNWTPKLSEFFASIIINRISYKNITHLTF